MSFSDKVTELKLKLHSVSKEKLKLERTVNSLRNKEYFLNEEVIINKAEKDSLLFQISVSGLKLKYTIVCDVDDAAGFLKSFIRIHTHELSSEISRMKYQKAIIDVCKESEKSKINVQLSYLGKHKDCYDDLFAKERAHSELKNELMKQKEAEKEEIEKQKMVKILEQQAKEAAVIEEECHTIERECSVLLKRNKAIMLKLRGKLIETEDIRRKLINNMDISNEFQE